MTDTSLGDILRATQACKTEDCLRELERTALGRGPTAEHDLGLVRDFFDQAKTYFTSRILARADIKPVVIGNGQNMTVSLILQTFRWHAEYDIRSPMHPYNGVWRPFETWCADNGLAPELFRCKDSKGREHWYVLRVHPAPVAGVPD
ncbi:hypothetical protein SAMN02800694_2798 [Luteibacter sp. UNCMF331Sha3.1]|uniref:hypothetical protein n=1 Tax=Luteibacter sp. UNCMF331Sha3.1 TaxID=1502760 RepID=UPI0008C261C7|nr:hypothetical protein [Luteibacter sp. UNCMF331Sha3.1]SEN10880.1 hypothetical protein SAMN02800694_2798 [Luteibacter sp. UNCMF331Sha3.1]